uniref:NocH-like protein n=1 Tax=Actinomyces sp. Lu 9419 TaxID=416175 RepID=B5SP76_9ACTO|nr:NocH-like protein [Actinomyces sp. Lu 9419]
MSDRVRPPAGFTAAMVIDAVGSGVWITFSLLYFSYGKGIELAAAGAALTAGALTALAAGGLAVGVLTDRLGPFPAAVLSCAVRTVAFPCYLLIDTPAGIAVVACAISFGDRLYWAAHGGLVRAVAAVGDDQRRVFATLNSLRNIGLGAGALAAAGAAAVEGWIGPATWDLIPLANAISFAAAAVLFARLAAGRGSRSRRAGARERGSYRAVLANRKFVVFAGATLAFTLASVAFDMLLPVHLRALGLPAWLPPLAYLLSCVAIPAFQPLALRMGARSDPMRLMAVSAGLLAAVMAGLVALAALTAVSSAVLLTALVLVFSLGEAVFGAVVMTVVLGFAGAGDTGRHTAFYQLAWGISGALGPGLHTALFSVAPAVPWLVLATALALAAVVYLRLARVREPTAAEAT